MQPVSSLDLALPVGWREGRRLLLRLLRTSQATRESSEKCSLGPGPGHLFYLSCPCHVGHLDTSPTPEQSSPIPPTPGYPQLAHAHRCTPLPLLLGCVCPNPAGHTGCTLSRHACTCVCGPSLCPSPFPLSSPATPILCIAQRWGAGGAGIQTRRLRSGSATLLFPFSTHPLAHSCLWGFPGSLWKPFVVYVSLISPEEQGGGHTWCLGAPARATFL